MKFLKAVFNFFVGDWIVLIGVAILLLVIALIENLPAFSSVKEIGGYLFIIGLVATLTITLRREVKH